MAARRTLKFLPGIFQTDTNQKFTSATMDQLISEPNFTNLYGYIGRTFAPTFESGDSYIIEPNEERQDYQLEPSIVIRDKQNNVTFFSTYVDLLNQIDYYGGITNNHSRLFDQEYYSFDPLISYDKFVNFSQYYWLPNGPDPVAVNTSGLPLQTDYTVTRNASTETYVFTSNNVVDNSITLARGGTYSFTVNQPGYPVWIQTSQGIDGTVPSTSTISNRDVLGVTNNGIDVGTITFNVPQANAQDNYLSMPTVYNINYATPIPYNTLQNKTLSQFLTTYPEYAGITGSINGKYLIFIDQDIWPNQGGDADWTNPVVHDNHGNVVPGYNAGTIISAAPSGNVALTPRYGIWQVVLVDAGITIPSTGAKDPLVQLIPIQDVQVNTKVYVTYGLVNANKEFYKYTDGYFYPVPLITAPLNTLYIQDATDPTIYQTVKIVNYNNWTIDVTTDILGQLNYTSPNGVEFTTGLKIQFGADVSPASYQYNQYYVEQVGSTSVGSSQGIRLVPVAELVTPEAYNTANALTYPGQIFPDYITINRSSIDRNAWSRNNRWFHVDVITATAAYNGTQPSFNQASRGQRPIIQFNADTLLYNYGRKGLAPIDILDTTTVDAFATLQGQPYTTAFGITLVDGLRVIFAAEADPLVVNKIYVVNLVQYLVDSTTGLPTGPYHIELTVAPDGDVNPYDSTVVMQGLYAGSEWWFNGTTWIDAQQKTGVQQPPLFDVFDPSGKSFSAYTKSTFKGTQIFGYQLNSAGVNDSVLGFPLTYLNFSTQGDIVFQNFFNTDTFTYANSVGNILSENISLGYLQSIINSQTLMPQNTWNMVPEDSKQYQQITYTYDGTNSPFVIDVVPKTSASIPYVKVYQNFTHLQASQWTLANSAITLSTTLTTGDQIVILVYSDQVSQLGFYQVPQNLDVNAQNIDFNTVTLGQMRNNLVALAQNSTVVVGNILGSSNLRDVDISAQGGTLLQHSAPVPYASLFLTDPKANFIDSLRYAQQEYTRFKNKFLQLAVSLSGLDQNNPAASVDTILTKINIAKNNSFPWYYSDMVPYGPLKNTLTYTVFDPTITNYEITSIFNDQALSNQAILVYFTPSVARADLGLAAGQTGQLIVNYQYSFSTNTPSVNLLINLEAGDIITIYEYSSTDGNYIPETPTKLGLWPPYIPQMISEDPAYQGAPQPTPAGSLTAGQVYTITYLGTTDFTSVGAAFNIVGTSFTATGPTTGSGMVNATLAPPNTIRGHDGSITIAYGDYRDALLLELELRIYNNIKLPDTGTYGDILEYVPGKFRQTVVTEGYSNNEVNQLLSPSFLSWIGSNNLDFSTNSTFDGNNPFTWNYSSFPDVIDGEQLPGSWRACYQYFYDTFRPNLTPWEMLGFAIMPDWWENYYGPAPYTGGNQLLWADLEAGRIVEGPRQGIDTHYARPGLSKVIPVDQNGNLLNPAEILAKSFDGSRVANAWAVGQYGPTEFAWRQSSEFPFAVQQAIALAKPAKYFGLLIDTYNYSYINSLYNISENTSTGTPTGSEQYLTLGTNHHLTQDQIDFNGDTSSGTVYRGAGYINWIADYLTNLGINPSTYITPLLQNYQVNLAYKAAGFTDQKYLQVLAEQVSPTSTNDSIVVPNESYTVYVNESPTPIGKLIYSAVIVEKTNSGYSVRGYDLNNAYFTIIPSVVNSNATKTTILNSSAVIFNNYQNLKLKVPYGFEFVSQQQVADFLISYQRYLIAQGFTFTQSDPTLGQVRNFQLSVKEFLYWAQQGWAPGSILVISPVADQISAISVGAITAGITDSQYGSKVLDQNFNLVKNNNYTVLRTASNFTLNLLNPASVIGYLEVDLVQFESALIFDNIDVFNDVIYQPQTGNRQYRLKLIGQKTGAWDGSLTAPGFMYNSGKVDTWDQGTDYLQGDLVLYKNQYYTALQDVIANPTFQFQYWALLTSTQIQTGLLPNFSTLAVEAQSYYDSYAEIKDKDNLDYSHALIGFKPRQYLTNLGLTETTQIEFYKGFITQKGTANAVNQMLRAKFNNLTSDINFYEEWAFRVGEYGALDSNPYLEIPLAENAFGVNPSIAQFVTAADNNLGNGVNIFNQNQLYRSYGEYTGNIALIRTSSSNYNLDIPTAGYVNLNDVDLTIFDLANYRDLDNNIANMGSGYRIWVALDFTQNWNVYRITETNNNVTQISNSLNGYITITCQYPHNLVAGTNTTEGSVFLIKGFSTQFDGFYQVYSVIDQFNVQVLFTGTLASSFTSQTATSPAILFRLDSMRFQFMEDARIYGLSNPPHGWQVGEKIWIDLNASTTIGEGVPIATANNIWSVYEKAIPWTYTQQLEKQTSEYVTGDNWGTSIAMTADNLVMVVGAPNGIATAANGSAIASGTVSTFLKNYAGQFTEGYTIAPLASNSGAFGSSVTLAVDANDNDILAVGSPSSAYGNGYVYIYNKPLSSTAFNRGQVIVGNTGDQLGTSLVFNADGEWLYVGAPNNGRVYAYGLNRFVPVETQTISVKNQVTLTLSGNITANVNQIVAQPGTGAQGTVVYTVTNSNTVVLTNLVSNFANANVIIGNITVGGIWASPNVSPTITPVSTSVTNSINLTFTPAVSGDANSLLVTNRSQTFIPNKDYVLNGSVINFTSGNIAQDDYVITQQPYYTLIQTLTIPTGNANVAFGHDLSCSSDGAQIAIGAPYDTVGGANGNLLSGAGSVWVYDRTIEAFNTTGLQTYTTKNTIGKVYKVTLDGNEVNNYLVTGPNTIQFVNPPPIGHILFIEVNLFNVLEQIIGVTSLTNDLSAIQTNANFGTALTVCPINCAIYIGAPYYDNASEYNSGAVWKFHNRGRLYGTNTGYKVNPTFTPGDSIRLNNFEVIVQARLMPTTITGNVTAYILPLSSNITATAGSYITQASSGANVTVLQSATNTNFITVSSYNNANTFNFGQSIVSANVVVVHTGNVSSNTTAFPMTSLDSFVLDVNNANILGVTAVNQGGLLTLNSDVTIVKDELRILSGYTTPLSAGVYGDADLRLFAFMQTILNPFGQAGEYFGSTVRIAQNAYMLVIGADRGTMEEFTTFDVTTTAGTTFDAKSTEWQDPVQGSGSAYIYELYDDPRDDVYTPGRYQYCQQLDPGGLMLGSFYGHAVLVEETYIAVAAPGGTSPGAPNGTGAVYIFENPTLARGWGLLRYQQATVDVDSISRAYLYSNQSNTILDNLQIFDPAKGRILGPAAQNISYQTGYDPAVYNQGNDPAANINTNIYWGANQVGKVWWNLSRVRFIDYEQDTLTYRSINWGSLFPGCVVEINEWVQSSYLPSQYVATGGDGVPKYADNSAYVQEIYVDPVTGIVTTNYYYWVTGKTTVDPTDPTRTLPTTAIADYIQNPLNQGLAYAAVISPQAIQVYNVAGYLSASNTILHLDYQLLINTDMIHTEYQLVQKGNPDDILPTRIVNKLVDSLAGIDQIGQTVPDPALSVADRYGISIRPRQTMFVDRLTAVSEMVEYVNSILIANPVVEQSNLSGMFAAAPAPSAKLNQFNLSVDTDIDLQYIDITNLPVGYLVLVNNDTTQDGLWVLYELTASGTWQIVQVQAYKTSLYWSYADWYATGYSIATKPTFSVATVNDAKALLPSAGDIIYITNATGNGTWQLIIVNTDGSFSTIGIQNGTIQLDSSLGNFAGNELGFGNQDFDSNRFDQDPTNETRYIVQALYNDIFVDQLKGEFNNMFFVLVNYLLTEQNYVDWLFKTSFISVTHQLRALAQYPSYSVDDQTYYQSYIEEVAPYRTTIREYLVQYDGTDEYQGNLTDFDLPAYYDTSTGYGIFRSPSGEYPYVAEDEATWQTFPYNQWYDNRTLKVSSILLQNSGSGYANVPVITITSTDGRGSGATAIANMSGPITGNANLSIMSITVTNPGSGYDNTPTVSINGSATVAATAYVQMNRIVSNATINTSNVYPLVRSFNSTLKFDRTTYSSSVQHWMPYTTYTAGQIVTYAYIDGNSIVRKAYSVNSNLTTTTTFLSNDYTVVTANTFTNASDRIVGYYQPSLYMPVVDAITVPLTLANTASATNTIYVFNSNYLLNGMYISGENVNAAYITNIVGNVAITLNSVTITVTQLTLSANIVNTGNVSLDTTITARFDSLDQVLTGVTYPSFAISGTNYKVSPLFGETFDNPAFDSVQYSTDGIPLLSTATIDKVIQSYYANIALGTAPEDVITDGGEYVDRYHSHAPEELIPGQTFDTLDMRIYTANIAINGNLEIIGYRVFDDMVGNVSYLHIGAANTTVLTQELHLTDGNIYVANAAALSQPNVLTNTPGVIFVDAERITYWSANIASNTLSQIRRGTQGTGAPAVHGVGTSVVDGSASQILPGTGNFNWTPNVNVVDTTTSGNTFTFLANVTYTRSYANVFYNSGVGTAVDGTGLQGSNTIVANIMKAWPVTIGGNIIPSTINAITSENTINIDTEDGQDIYTET